MSDKENNDNSSEEYDDESKDDSFYEDEESIDPLFVEKRFLKEYLPRMQLFGIQQGVRRKKNANDAKCYRLRGNRLFKSASHDSDTHQKILNAYSKSVALAPHASEELAFAYGNRAALLLHLKIYSECLKDCNLALNIATTNEFKAKILCRKVECLVALKDPTCKRVLGETLHLIRDMELDSKVRTELVKKLDNANFSTIHEDFNLKVCNTKSEDLEEKRQSMKLPEFIHQKEAPCASEAVAIEYNTTWGRYIVATRDIEPGEIIAIEKCYYSFIFPNWMYVYCSNCSHLVWSSIPCEHCIYGVYCSEKCRGEAWNKFHKYECNIYPYLWDIDQDVKVTPSTLRLLLIMIHEAGSIQELKKQFLEMERSEDARTKGFSENGIFHSNSYRSILSLDNSRDDLEFDTMASLPQNAVVALYYLATSTTFFGEKLNIKPMDMVLLEDVWFVGALLLRLFFMMPKNMLCFTVYRDHLETDSHGVTISAFSSLLNHSCDPNIHIIKTKNNERLIFAKHPIAKGEQLFCSYYSDYLDSAKAERQKMLNEMKQFECKCLACEEDWSKICLPSVEDMLQYDKKTYLEIAVVLRDSHLVFKDPQCEISWYNLELMEELKKILQVYAEKVSVHCDEYEYFAEFVYRLYNKSFGSWLCIPDDC